MQVFGILGAGTLGWKIGLQAAISGFDVLMYDLSEGVLAKAAEFQAQTFDRLVKLGRVEAHSKSDTLGRIRSTTDPSAFAKTVDFVSESITEELELKQKVWTSFAGRWKPSILLTTNTSYLLPSQMAAQSGDPSNFCAFHFHDVFEARVVDVMPHPGTATQHIETLMALGRRLNQIPVHVQRETSGYLFNRMLMAYLGAAGGLLAKDLANIEDIDRSWMGNMGMPIGPFGMLDQIGLDTVAHILHTRKDEASQAFASVIAPLIEAGHLGVKTGRGFYRYPRPAFAQTGFLA